MGEYDQYRAVGACYYRGELAFAPGQPIPASHPRLSRWLSDGLAVSTGATTTRAVTARALLSLRTRAGKVGHVDVPAAPSFDVAAWSTGAAVAAAAAPVAKPSGTVAGDLLLAVHTCDPNGNLAGMTAPDGSWSPAGTGGSSPSGFGKVWTKVAGSSEPDGYTFNGPAGGASVLISDSFSGGSWSSSWLDGFTTAGATATIVSGMGRLYTGSLTNYDGTKSMRANLAARLNTEILLDLRFDTTESFQRLTLRGDAGDDAAYGYVVFIEKASPNGATLARVSNYTATNLGFAGFAVAANVTYRIRYRVQGSNIKFRIWDSAGSEPGTWNIDVTDGSPYNVAGYCLIHTKGGAAAGAGQSVDNVTISDPDVPASAPEQQVTLLRCTGVSATSPFQVDPVWAAQSAASTAHVASSVVTTGKGILLNAFHAIVNARNTWTVPAGQTGAAALSTGGISYDFAAQDSTNWTGWGANVAIATGRLRITPTTGYPALQYATNRSLVGASITAEVPTVPNVGNGGTVATMYFQPSVGNRVELLWANNSLISREVVASSTTDTSVTYSAANHRWWRIREALGVVYWETSPDNVTWTVQRSKVTALALSNGVIVMASGFGGTEPTPGFAEFDNFTYAPNVVASTKLVSWQVLPSATTTGTRTATSSATSVAAVGSLMLSCALRLAGNEPPPAGGGMPSKVAGEVWHTWCPPNLADWPADVIGSGTTAGLCNHVVALIAQSAASGTGQISWAPGDGTSGAAATAAIGAVRSRGVNVILAIGGSDNGGVRLTSSTHVTEMKASIASLKTTYGFNGIELWLKYGWTQAQVVTLYSDLKTAHGSTWVNGLWVDLYPPLTAPWLALIAALGSSLDYVTLHLHDFVECRDSRLTQVTLDKIKLLTDAGFPASKILCFFMTKPPEHNWPNSSPLGVTRAAWIAAKAANPTLLGAVHYESRSEGGKTPSWPWLRDVGALVRT